MKFAIWKMWKRNEGGAEFCLETESLQLFLFYLASMVLYLLEFVCIINGKK